MRILSTTAAAAALLVLSSASADALSLRLTDLSGSGSTTINDNGVGDSLGGLGAIGFLGGFGAFNLNFTGGTSTTYPPEAGLTLMSLNASSSTAGSLRIELTETGYTIPSASPFVFDVGLTSNPTNDATVTIESYADASNAAFGMSSLLGSVSSSNKITDNLNASPALSGFGAGPFSLTHVITLTHGVGSIGPSVSDARTDVSPVPVPAALPLFAAALGLMGVLTRRRRDA